MTSHIYSLLLIGYLFFAICQGAKNEAEECGEQLVPDTFFDDLEELSDLHPTRFVSNERGVNLTHCLNAFQVEDETQMHIRDAMEASRVGTEDGKTTLFFMLNGLNTGLHVSTRDWGCLGTVVYHAADALRVNDYGLSNPIRLYSIHGTPVSTAEQGSLCWHSELFSERSCL